MLSEFLAAAFSVKFGFFILLIVVIFVALFISKQYKLNWWGLVSVDGKKVSKGNLAFWIIFAVQVYYWIFEPTTVIAGLQETFLMVLGYCLGTKFNTTAKDRLFAKSENEKEQIENEKEKFKLAFTKPTKESEEIIKLIGDLK